MRLIPLAIALAALPALVHSQDKADRPKMPGKGDQVIVTGCVMGSAFEAHDTRRVDETSGLETAITFRLTGGKDRLKELRSEHANHFEEITGVLRSVLPDSNLTRGKQIGKTRVFIGGATPPASGAAGQAAAPHMPVLEVRSFRHIGDRCGM